MVKLLRYAKNPNLVSIIKTNVCNVNVGGPVPIFLGMCPMWLKLFKLSKS